MANRTHHRKNMHRPHTRRKQARTGNERIAETDKTRATRDRGANGHVTKSKRAHRSDYVRLAQEAAPTQTNKSLVDKQGMHDNGNKTRITKERQVRKAGTNSRWDGCSTCTLQIPQPTHDKGKWPEQTYDTMSRRRIHHDQPAWHALRQHTTSHQAGRRRIKPRRASADTRVHLRRDFFSFSICLFLTQHLLMARCHLLCSPTGDAVMVVTTSLPLFVTMWSDRNCRSKTTPLTAPPTRRHTTAHDTIR